MNILHDDNFPREDYKNDNFTVHSEYIIFIFTRGYNTRGDFSEEEKPSISRAWQFSGLTILGLDNSGYHAKTESSFIM